MKAILVIDDEERVCWAFEEYLTGEGYRVFTAYNAEHGLQLAREHEPDVILLDIQLPGMDGLEALKQIKSLLPETDVIMITAYGSSETTIRAIQLGAYDYITKPPDLHAVQEVIERAVQARELGTQFDSAETTPAPIGQLIGQSPAMQQIYKLIGMLTTNTIPVLIEGETGTGKELVAQAIHANSMRSQGPFIAVNCGALPDTLLESELFGYERGAFTGATSSKPGKFELADGGTLFLDEASSMSPALQVKLLRVLQNSEFERLGGTEAVHIDVRIIAATNVDLTTLVRSGIFREDLYYRLKPISITLPPLRERKEDIPPLVEHFLALSSKELSVATRGVADGVMDRFLCYDWPGNVRELQNAIRSAMVRTRSNVILPEHLPEEIRDLQPIAEKSPGGNVQFEQELKRYVQRLLLDPPPENFYQRVVDHVDRILLQSVLEHVEGNQVRAAKLLDISRTTLRKKLESLAVIREEE